MMELPFKCENCKHQFKTIDEIIVICPECKQSNVIVEWDRYETN